MTTFDPEEWVEVAELCCDRIAGISGEALLRAALNRAYYAALLCVKRRIEDVHGPGAVPQFQTHASILGALRTGGSAFTDIRRGLQSLQAFREKADYELRSSPLVWGVGPFSGPHQPKTDSHAHQALPDAEFRRLQLPRR